MFSDKYICGLIDSDGCISIQYCKTPDKIGHYAYARLELSESPNKSNLLPRIQTIIGGTILESERTNNVGTFPTRILRFTGANAVSTLNRLKQHLVVKLGVAELACSINGTKVKREEIKSKVKELRATGQHHPDFLSRKWLSGWLDGNGSITGAVSASGKFQPELKATAWKQDRFLLELIVKQFGGTIYDCKGEQAYQYYLYMGDPSKCIEMLEHIKDVVILKPRRDYLLNLARTSNFHDGKAIREMFKTLRPAAETKSISTSNSEVIVQ